MGEMNEDCVFKGTPWYDSQSASRRTSVEFIHCVGFAKECTSCGRKACDAHGVKYCHSQCNECSTLKKEWISDIYRENYEKIYMTKTKACKH